MIEASALTRDLPYLSADLSGVGGIIKRYNEDFVVEETPLYPASGAGTHVYFQIEKQGMTTLAAIQRIARALGRHLRDVGYAGMKDAHGVTRQWLSLEHMDPARIEQIEIRGLRVLHITRHSNKIKLGHLAGNRFDIKIRELRESKLPESDRTADPTAFVPQCPGAPALDARRYQGFVPSVKPVADASFACAKGSDPAARTAGIMEVLKKRGVPNYFGPQRFGARGDNALIGLAVVRQDYNEALTWMLGRAGPIDHGAVRTARELYDAGQLSEAAEAWPGAFQQQKRVLRALIKSDGDALRAWRAVDHTLRKLYISALQSELFNRILARRIDRTDLLETGDVAWKHANGACFRVEDAAIEQPRCDAFEISPSGPLYGRRMTEPLGAPAEWEARALLDAGLSREQLVAQDGAKLDGARRPLRVPLGDAGVDQGEDERGPFLLVTFSLPAGAYATSVVREICKNDTDDSVE